MWPITRIVLAGVVAWVVSCTTATPRLTQMPADGGELEVVRDWSGAFSSFEREGKWLIHEPRGLSKLPVNIGEVDFAREMVLAIAAGPVSSPRHTVRLTRLYRDGPVLKAEIEYGFPDADVTTGGTPASPYHIVVTPRSDLNILGFKVLR